MSLGDNRTQDKVRLGDKVRIRRGCVGEGYTFFVTSTGTSGHGERVVYGSNYGPVRESEVELVAPMRCDR